MPFDGIFCFTVESLKGGFKSPLPASYKRLVWVRSISDNFKRRFGDPARIEIKYAKDKLSPAEKSYRNEKMATAYVEVLRGILGREPTQDEILGKVDVSNKETGI